MSDLPDRPSELNSPDAAPATYVHFSDTQLDTIARMLVAGIPHAEIAAAFRVTAHRIRTLDRANADMQDRKARFAGEVTRQVVMMKFRMFEKLDLAIGIIEKDGLHSQDTRVRLENAKWWFDHTLPPLEQRHAVAIQLPDELIDAVRHMAANDAGLREVQRTKPALLSRVRTTFDQLPAPTAEPAPEPTSDASSSDSAA